MQLSDFDYHLPEELIARYPLKNRSASQLLHLQRQTGKLQVHPFTGLSQLLRPNDLLIFNDTKVIRARLYAQKTTGAKLEILIERILSEQQVLAHVKPAKALKTNMVFYLADKIQLKAIQREGEFWRLEFLTTTPILNILEQYGNLPLPPYLQRQAENEDGERYQTIFAKQQGAVAAPTAGLHFDETIFQQLREKNIDFGFITLHVGAGTFQPVRVQNILQHKMHSEYLEVPAEICAQIAACREKGGRVIAVGTTVVRSLETAAQQTGSVQPYIGETNIFIYPGYHIRTIDALITNFHLPKSTLLMLISAFSNREQILSAYQFAIQQRLRFYSYGDAMFIE